MEQNNDITMAQLLNAVNNLTTMVNDLKYSSLQEITTSILHHNFAKKQKRLLLYQKHPKKIL